MSQPVLQADFPGLNLIARGKVRDIYNLGDSLLLVTSDRISAFDVIMNKPIPDKGFVLTQISAFWFRRWRTSSKIILFPPMLPITRRRAAHMPIRWPGAPCW